MKYYTLSQLQSLCECYLYKGDKSHMIDNIRNFDESSESSISFYLGAEFKSELKKNPPKSCITSNVLLPDIADIVENILVSENPYLSFAKLSQIFSPGLERSSNIGKGSVISDSALIGKNVVIGNNCSIEGNVKIGDGTFIDHNVVIYNNSSIGQNCFISSGVVIGSQGFGYAKDNSGKWKHIYHSGGVKICDNVHIGSNTCIDRGTLGHTLISNGVIIDNNVHIAHNVSIKENTAIAAKTGIAGSSTIGSNCQIGGMVGIYGKAKVSDDVIISPKSSVYRDIKNPGFYSGTFPLLSHSNWKKVSTLLSKIDKIIKNLKKTNFN